ncbi:hypothetical protein [Leadbettera azotonutricia]|uniref:Uncharacterized protein n=1 Tax=Leadbettera azotonutricia (strain ATCC BAA-888 / DSM 13862 / ZAS-9) TaxID=545695 RepID=F5Y7N4_LEAAZ|nr:hypothetical protein [Leadbettera azotonutricia]AEF82042.1 hypothetical protein TREAZ_1044 [Leadbettera azotonutricia ZAS-9]
MTEQKILAAFENLLTGRVNEILQGCEFKIAPVEFDAPAGVGAVAPVLRLTECERSEKERIVRLDAFALTVSLNVPETADSERDVYAYGAAVGKAVAEDSTLGGVADRAVITGKKYVPPKKAYCGDGWELVISLRVIVEGMTV